MSERIFDPFEPEETVGKIWHAYASRLDARAEHDDNAVALEDISGRLRRFLPRARWLACSRDQTGDAASLKPPAFLAPRLGHMARTRSAAQF